MRSNGEIVSMAIANGVIDHALRVYRVHARHADDLRQEVCLILLQLDNERLNEIVNDGKLPHFVTRIVRNQYRSKDSDFYRKYRKYEQTALYNTNLDFLADE